MLESRLREMVEGTAKAYGAKAKLTYKRDYPVTRNHAQQTDVRGRGRRARWSAANGSTPTRRR